MKNRLHTCTFEVKSYIELKERKPIKCSFVIENNIKKPANPRTIVAGKPQYQILEIHGKIISKTTISYSKDVGSIIKEYFATYGENVIDDEVITNYCQRLTGNSNLHITISKIYSHYETYIYETLFGTDNELIYDSSLNKNETV